MVRAAAKNHARVSVVVEPSDYAGILATLPDGPPPEMRSMLALKARRRGVTKADSRRLPLTDAPALPALATAQIAP